MTVSFEEAGKMLDRAAEKLPEEVFRGLNGGVNLIRGLREDDDGFLTMGMYIVDQMGRRVEIYYGSFAEAFPDAPREEIERELDLTLRHELTHHMENLAGDRSLEHWDEQHRLELLAELEPLRAGSVLFVSGDDSSLGPAAEALFRAECARRGMNIKSASAGLKAAAALEERCVRAVAGLGADMSGHVPQNVTGELLAGFDAVLCMTRAEAETLAGEYPEFDERIMCLGRTDYHPPKLGLRGSWAAAAGKMRDEARCLADELAEGETDGD